jgi:APA family basic amino acid/polyamine antiporter
VTPALFIAAAVAIVVNTALTRPVQALVGLGIVATGIPAFLVWRRRAAADARDRPPSLGAPDGP